MLVKYPTCGGHTSSHLRTKNTQCNFTLESADFWCIYFLL